MAQTIKLKRSAQSGASGIPSTSDLALGEVGINTYHGKMYIKKDDGTESIVEVGSTASFLPLSGGSLSGNLSLGDNVKAQFGAGNDLQIYHSGTHSHIRNTTGNLYLQDDGYVEIGSPSGEVYIGAVKDGAVNLRHDNSIKLATTATGADISGVLTADGLTVSNGTYHKVVSTFPATYTTNLQIGQQGNINNNALTDTLLINHNAQATQSNVLFNINDKSVLKLQEGGDISFYEDTGTTPKLFWDASLERLGLRTSTPIDTLDIRSGGLRLYDNTDGNGGVISFGSSSGYQTIGGGSGSNDMHFRTYANHIFKTTTGASSTTDGTERLKINSSGIDVNGSVVADGLTVSSATSSNSTFINGVGTGMQITLADQIWSAGVNQNAGSLYLQAGGLTNRLKIASNGDISFYNDSANQGLFWDSSTSRLGLGTTVPSAKLETVSTNAGGDATLIQIRNGSTNQSTSSSIRFVNSTAGTATAGGAELSAVRDNDAGGDLVFKTAAQSTATLTTALTLNSSQNATFSGSVTSTGLPLNVNTSMYATDHSLSYYSSTNGVYLNGAGNSGWLRLNASGGSNDSVSHNLFGINAGNFQTFKTNSTERMRIDSSGNVGIGTSNSTPSNGKGMCLGSDSAITRLDMRNSTTGDVTGDGTSLQLNGNNFTIENRENGYVAIATSLIERLRIDSSGSVGIGTSSPSTKVEISGTGFQTLSVTSTNSSPVLKLNSAASSTAFLQWNNAGSSPLSFYDLTASAERMRIDSSGNILVGTTSSVSTSSSQTGAEMRANGIVVGAVNGNVSFIGNRIGSDGDIALFRRDGTTKGNISVSAYGMGFGGGTRSSDFFIKTDGTASFASGVNLGVGTSPDGIFHVKATGGVQRSRFESNNSHSLVRIIAGTGSNTGLEFYSGTGNVANITADSSSNILFEPNGSESARLTSGGEFLIGASSAGDAGITLDGSPSGNSVPSMELVRDFSGTATMIRFTNISGSPYVGSITSTTSATAYNTSSDERLKDNIVDAPSASEDIDAIQVRSFDWKVDCEHQKYGMVAQELLEVAPDAVTQGDTPDDMMGVDYSKLVPMLIKEIQSLRQRVAQLEE